MIIAMTANVVATSLICFDWLGTNEVPPLADNLISVAHFRTAPPVRIGDPYRLFLQQYSKLRDKVTVQRVVH